MCVARRVVVAKPYLTIYIDSAAEFPVTIPIRGSILRCTDLPDTATARCLEFVSMHQPLGRSATRVQELQTERYRIQVVPYSLVEQCPDVPPPPACTEEDVTHVIIDRQNSAVQGIALAIHHTSRSLLFPVFSPDGQHAECSAVLVYEGGMAPFEHVVHCVGMRDCRRTRTLRAPTCTTVERGDSYVRHVEARAVLNIELVDNAVVLKNPHIVAMRVSAGPESTPGSFCALKYG
uniref:Uncharacterized protein n=1 Tax=Rousettus bat poxvirus TaxID=3141933 RepID=A0AAU7E1C3_9POXV